MDTTDFTNRIEQENEDFALAEQKRNDEEDRNLDKKTIKETPWVEDTIPHAGIALGYSKIDYEPQDELDRQSNFSSYQAFRGY